jgi:hypothetical protein
MSDDTQFEAMVPRQEAGIAPIGRLRAELVEAKEGKSIPRLQRVIGAATVAAEAQRRVARLAERGNEPVEIVGAAREGARQAATVQLEAMAAAGRIIQEKQESGEIAKQGDFPRGGAEIPRRGNTEPPKRMEADLGISHSSSHRWQRIGDIPDEVREEYVQGAASKNQDVTMSGLLRFANPKPEPESRDNMEVAYDDVVRHLSEAMRYDPKVMAAHANLTKRKTQFKKLMDSMRDWIEKTDAVLGR